MRKQMISFLQHGICLMSHFGPERTNMICQIRIWVMFRNYINLMQHPMRVLCLECLPSFRDLPMKYVIGKSDRKQ